MEHVLDLHTVILVAGDMAGTVAENDSDDVEHKLVSPSKTIVMFSPSIGSKIEQVVLDLTVVHKADVEGIFKCGLTKLTSSSQLYIKKRVWSWFRRRIRDP